MAHIGQEGTFSSVGGICHLLGDFEAAGSLFNFLLKFFGMLPQSVFSLLQHVDVGKRQEYTFDFILGSEWQNPLE